MGTVEQGSVYDTLVDLLIQGGNREQILKFRLGAEAQSRLDELLDRNRNGTITPVHFLQMNSVDRLSEREEFARAGVFVDAHLSRKPR